MFFIVQCFFASRKIQVRADNPIFPQSSGSLPIHPILREMSRAAFTTRKATLPTSSSGLMSIDQEVLTADIIRPR